MPVHSLSYHLVVCVTRARNLANRDHDEHWGQSASDPYVGIFVGDVECVSTPMRDSPHPVLHKCCDFGEQPATALIDIAVSDADMFGDDDLIGTACMSPGMGASRPLWLPLTAPDGATWTPGDVEVAAHLLPSHEGASQLSVQTENARSSGDATSVSVSCPDNTVLVGCSCSRDDPNAPTFPVEEGAPRDLRCASANILAVGASRSCVATADVDPTASMPPGGAHVEAHARCLRHPSMARTWSSEDVQVGASGVSSSHVGDAVTATCGSGSSLLACNAVGGPPDGFRAIGVQIEATDGGDECVALAGLGPLGSGVRAQVVCSPPDAEVLAFSSQSDRVQDPQQDEAQVRCPRGFALTGCSCYSPNGNCAGARPQGEDTCVAQLAAPAWFWAAGGRAVATCVYTGDRAEVPSRAAGGGGRPPSCSAQTAVAARLGNHRWMDQAVSAQILTVERAWAGGVLFTFVAGMCCCGLLSLCAKCGLQCYRKLQLRRMQFGDGSAGELGAPVHGGTVSSTATVPMLSAQVHHSPP